MPVLDASVLVAYLSGGQFAHEARAALFADTRRNWAPHLVDAEVGHALRRIVGVGELSARAARAALDDLADLPLRRVAHGALLGRAWELRANVTFYDGLYVALAERLELGLVTLDARLAAAPGVRARIETLA
ncbi:MAG: type II toxin-antitoxin system VapC family toxin [Solirubrobacteraceae bacterium]|nr:type II toxin-antitoxin system VapC family toxin [Solirubrobacteraceae bacterium]